MPLNLRQTQLREFSILKAFRDFCNDNGLTYYLCGGTLLGAVRHKGFIPWDDDIDVAMPRADYEKFYSLTAFHPIQPNIITSTYRPCQNRMLIPFIKLIDTKTYIVGRLRECRKIKGRKDAWHTGLWIDIFPIDKLPDDFEATKRLYARQQKYNSKFSYIIKEFSLKNCKFYTLPLKRLYQFLFVRIIQKRICHQRDKIAQTYNNTQTSYCGVVDSAMYGVNERVPNDVFTPSEGTFEGEQFCIPKGYDCYLHSIYGDYMQLPPVEERRVHSAKFYLVEEG